MLKGSSFNKCGNWRVPSAGALPLAALYRERSDVLFQNPGTGASDFDPDPPPVRRNRGYRKQVSSELVFVYRGYRIPPIAEALLLQLLVERLDLVKFQLDRGFAAEHGNRDVNLVLIRFHRRYYADKAGQCAIDDTHAVAGCVV